MIKVRDNVVLKELEKYGFKKENWGYAYYPNNNTPQTRYFSAIKIEKENKIIRFNLENMSIWCNDLDQLELDFENIRNSYIEFRKKISELKEAGLIEEIV